MAPAPAADGAPKKKKKKKSGRKPKAEGTSQEGLDKRACSCGTAVFGAMLVAFVAYLGYDTFLKPASIVGTWKGSRLEYEIGRAMSYNQYLLVLDESKRASLTLQEGFTSVGTYTVNGDQLIISFGGGEDKRKPGARQAKAPAAGNENAPGAGNENAPAAANGGEDEEETTRPAAASRRDRPTSTSPPTFVTGSRSDTRRSTSSTRRPARSWSSSSA